MLPDMGMIRLADMATRLPAVAAEMRGGCWTRAAEEALLATGRIAGSQGSEAVAGSADGVAQPR